MLLFLRCFFIVVIVSMLAVTSWASWRCPLFDTPRAVATHPWFIATLFDTYWAFLTFYIWVFFKQTAWLARAAWLVAILLLGNIAMAAYCLAVLCKVPANTPLSAVLTSRNDRPGWLGILLALLGASVLLLA